MFKRYSSIDFIVIVDMFTGKVSFAFSLSFLFLFSSLKNMGSLLVRSNFAVEICGGYYQNTIDNDPNYVHNAASCCYKPTSTWSFGTWSFIIYF